MPSSALLRFPVAWRKPTDRRASTISRGATVRDAEQSMRYRRTTRPGVQDMLLAHFRNSLLQIAAAVPFSTVGLLEWRESFGIQPNAT